MFGLFCGFWNYMVEKKEAKVLLVGLDKAGKTVIFNFSQKQNIKLLIQFLDLFRTIKKIIQSNLFTKYIFKIYSNNRIK